MDPTLIAIVFPLVFIALWVGMTAFLRVFSGWAHLEEYHPDKAETAIETLRFQGFYLGEGRTGASYRGCVTFVVCQSGLRVRIWKVFALFSKPIFIRWDAMEIERAKIMMLSATRLKIGRGGKYWMTLGNGTAKRIASASGGQFEMPR